MSQEEETPIQKVLREIWDIEHKIVDGVVVHTPYDYRRGAADERARCLAIVDTVFIKRDSNDARDACADICDAIKEGK